MGCVVRPCSQSSQRSQQPTEEEEAEFASRGMCASSAKAVGVAMVQRLQ